MKILLDVWELQIPLELRECIFREYYGCINEGYMEFRPKPTREEYSRGVVSPSARTATLVAMEFDEAMRKSFFGVYTKPTEYYISSTATGTTVTVEDPREENDRLREQEGDTEWK
jgi:hypothetical protein